MMITMKILQIESLIINIKALLVLAMYHILCVVSQNGYYGHFNDMNCNAIVIWWYENSSIRTSTLYI